MPSRHRTICSHRYVHWVLHPGAVRGSWRCKDCGVEIRSKEISLPSTPLPPVSWRQIGVDLTKGADLTGHRCDACLYICATIEQLATHAIERHNWPHELDAML